MWVDSHCHLQSVSDPGAALRRARKAGVDWMVCVGTDLDTSKQAIGLPSLHRDVRATVGLHPHDASRLAVERDELEALSTAPGVVAIGEAGFDLHYRHSSPEEQEAAFRWQIAVAKRVGLPLVIHSREAWPDTFRVLRDEGVPEPTVFHCFTGGPGEAAEALSIGAYLSFSGIVSFPGADEVRAAAAATPAGRLLVETDAPYLAPVPYRGRENEPAFVTAVGEAVATARGDHPADLAAATSTAAANVFAPRERGIGEPGAGEE
jgi:TatD DNase family protein